MVRPALIALSGRLPTGFWPSLSSRVASILLHSRFRVGGGGGGGGVGGWGGGGGLPGLDPCT